MYKTRIVFRSFSGCLLYPAQMGSLKPIYPINPVHSPKEKPWQLH
ncbi:hypothetical protein [Kingella sp. (in: b-proteobacteria)]|nr:hypothetical protein [Kingella sp. (in: b-proteobacteria)]MDO4658649.1 hypothetical protein [Kingella sp. (in: b-proteobacteria)]